MWVRQGPQQDGIYYREDGAVDAEAESECKKSDGGKARIPTKYTQTVVQILPTRFYKGFPAARTNDFLANFEASPVQADCAKGLLATYLRLDCTVGG